MDTGQGEAEKQLATRDEWPQQKAKVGYITWLHASPKMPTEWDYAHNGHLSNVIQSELLAPTYTHTSAEREFLQVVLSFIKKKTERDLRRLTHHKCCLVF